MASPPIYQPIHPSLRPLLDPEYVVYHDKYMQYILPDDQKKWDGSARTAPSLPPGGSPLTPVKQTVDIQLQNCRLRLFIPEMRTDEDQIENAKLPTLLWFHGGGWAIGGLDSENDFCSYICQSAIDAGSRELV